MHAAVDKLTASSPSLQVETAAGQLGVAGGRIGKKKRRFEKGVALQQTTQRQIVRPFPTTRTHDKKIAVRSSPCQSTPQPATEHLASLSRSYDDALPHRALRTQVLAAFGKGRGKKAKHRSHGKTVKRGGSEPLASARGKFDPRG